MGDENIKKGDGAKKEGRNGCSPAPEGGPEQSRPTGACEGEAAPPGPGIPRKGKLVETKNAVPRPALMVAIVIGSLFMVEIIIMNFFHEFAETAHGTMDALILATVLLPLIHFFIYRPFSQSVNDLKAFSGTLERRVRERTVQLEFSEALHRAVIASSADAIVRINSDGAILSANPAAHWMSGYGKTELENKHISLLLPDGYERVLVEGFAASLDGWNGHSTAPVAEAVAVTKSGQKLTVECASSECLVNSEISFVIIMRDVTARKKAEDALRESETRFRQFSDAGFEGIFINIEGKVVDCNDAFARMFGYAPEEVIGKMPSDMAPPESNAIIMEHIRRGSEGVYGVMGRKKDGTLFPIEMRGRNILYRGQKARITAMRDITERVKAEQAIRESEERFRQLSEASFEGIIVSIQGKVVDCNRAFARMFGYAPEEIIGKMPVDLSTPESQAVIMDHVRRESEEVFDVVGRKKDGTLFPIEVQGRGILYHGQKARIIAIRDITARKLNEGLLRESEQKFMRFFTMLPVALGVVDKDGVISEFNARFTAIFGYTVGDVPTIKEWWERAYPDETYRRWVRDTWGAAVDKAAKEGTDIEPIEYKVTCKNGAERFVMIGGIILLNGDVLATFVDVTEKRKAEDELRRSEEELRKAQEIAHVGNWHWDMVNNTLWWSDEIYRIFGRAPREFGATYEAFLSHVHPDDRVYVRQRVDDAIAKRSRYDIDHRIITGDGIGRIVHEVAEVSYDGAGRAVGMVGTVQDITAQKTAEDNLRASEQRFRAVAQSATDAIISINSGGEIVHWNRGAEKLFGHAEDEVRGKPVEIIIPRRHDEAHRRGLARAVNGGLYRLVGKTVTLEGLRKDGSEFPLELSLAAWEEGGRTYFTGIIRDITERMRVENALFESENKFRALVEETSDWVWEMDQNGTFTYSSPQVREITGYGPEEILGKTPFDYMRPEEAKRVVEFFRATSADRKPFKSFEHSTLHKDGDEIVVETSGVPYFSAEGKFVGYRGINRDVTARKEAEKNTHLMSLFPKFNPGPIIRCDVNGVILMANPAALAVFEAEDLQGVKVQTVIPGFGMIDLASIIRDGLLINYTAVLNKGCFQFAIKGVTELGVLNIYGSDITARKAAEENLKTAKEAAEEATRMKDKFVSLVSHDLKTPLSSMIGFLKLVRNDYAEPLNEGAKLILDRAAESGESMVRLIEDLLTISRFKTGQLKLNRQFFDAEYLGVMMAGNYSHLAIQKGIKIESVIPANSRIYGDKTLLTEAVQNLVTNAIKFCKSGDRITISLAEKDASTVCVRDTGPGIQPNLLADLFKFEKKTSTRGTAGETGTGFGLPLVKEIMQLHGGELGVNSDPGKGCLFSLKLPFVRPKILLVDDERNTRLLQIMQLRELNADIIEAENGEDALNMMTVIRPDLVITDIQMPVMDGLELLKRIKGSPNTKAIPVIVMSGEFGMEIRDTIFKFGGDDFVTKNKTDKADFIPRVRRFIG